MARVTDPEVRAIIPDTDISDLTPYITSASLLVDRAALTECGASLLPTELVEVEKWLSAHYAAVSDPSLALQSERFENAQNVYSRGKSDKGGILSTQYGQMANTMSNGCLMEADLQTASYSALGGCYE